MWLRVIACFVASLGSPCFASMSRVARSSGSGFTNIHPDGSTTSKPSDGSW